jgi:iron complex transport system ATP-binding protein
VLGPNGAGKTTLLHVAGASLYPTRGTVVLLGEQYGSTDLGELRTRIGLSSASFGDRIPPHEKALDVVVTASYGVVGRWSERYDPATSSGRRTCWPAPACAPSPTAASARCPRASASGCCWPGR